MEWNEKNIVAKYMNPTKKFRMLVGYPDSPLDFREINVEMETDFFIKPIMDKHYMKILSQMHKDIQKEIERCTWGKWVD